MEVEKTFFPTFKPFKERLKERQILSDTRSRQ